MYRVPFVDPRAHYRKLKLEMDKAITDCLARGELIDRDELRRFEEKLAELVGVRYAVGVASGYHALHFSLLAAGIGPGDEVITVAHTFVATISAIGHCGATPVLVDVGDDYNMDPEALERAITPRTRAVIPVHLNGRACAMERILAIAEKRGLKVIEDAAQALGATYQGRRAGSMGLTGCFSFYPFKILGGFGDGGAITTDDPKVARLARLLRYNGEDRESGEYHCHGYTALLDNVQAAVLEVKLRHLPEWIRHRRAIAECYQKHLQHIPELRLPHFPGAEHHDVFQNYVVRCDERDALREHLRRAGIETLVHWPKPVWRHEALRLGVHSLPETESICRQVMSLPMSAETSEEHVAITAQAIREFFAEERGRAAAGASRGAACQA